MTATLHSIPAPAIAVARKLNRDDRLVMTVCRGVVYTLGSDGQWTGSGRSDVADVVRDCERTGDGYAAYYVVEADGSHSRID